LNKNKYSRHAFFTSLLLALSSQPLLATVSYTSTCNAERRKITKYLHIIEYRLVSGVFQTIDHPPPLHLASVSFPRTPGGERGGGSIFWKTPDIGLASYSIIPLRERLRVSKGRYLQYMIMGWWSEPIPTTADKRGLFYYSYSMLKKKQL
jgi:hypothetical protein